MFPGTWSAGDDAAAYALQNMSGSVQGDADAFVAALNSSLGTVSAGRDAAIISGGSVSSTVMAGRDVAVVAYGTVTGGGNFYQRRCGSGDVGDSSKYYHIRSRCIGDGGRRRHIPYHGDECICDVLREYTGLGTDKQ